MLVLLNYLPIAASVHYEREVYFFIILLPRREGDLLCENFKTNRSIALLLGCCIDIAELLLQVSLVNELALLVVL